MARMTEAQIVDRIGWIDEETKRLSDERIMLQGRLDNGATNMYTGINYIMLRIQDHQPLTLLKHHTVYN